jgi:16S rRNA (uracil1498-N3)-methyltransferase
MSLTRLVIPGLFLRVGVFTVDKEFARHAKVLRLRPDDDLILCDGNGREMQGKVVTLSSDALCVELTHELTPLQIEPVVQITLLQGIPKGDKMELILQKATELGVSRIVPVAMSRSVAKYDKNPPRWEKIVQEAARQSGRATLPSIEPVTSFTAGIKRWVVPGCSFLLDETGEGVRLREALPKKTGEALALVGPEGGLAPEERRASLDAGFIPVYLGTRILRTETAAITIVALLQHYYGDLG